jgi:hypothetical protein
MKKYMSWLILLVMVISLFQPSLTSYAAVSDWQKGASVYPNSTSDFNSSTFQQSLQNLKNAGANYVSLIVPIYQANDNSSDIYAGGDTPTDASLVSAIQYAHNIGLKVILKPHLGSQTGGWRANINASNRDAWFQNYGNMLNKYGDIAKQNGVEGICIGTELISMATYTSNGDNTQRWNKVISSLRTHFGGFLTYSANWGSGSFAEEVPHIGFWPSLDFIGISAYYPLAQGQSNPSVNTLIDSWNNWSSSKIKPLADQYGKKVLFTEVGYRSVDNAHNDPYDGGRGGNTNLQEQSNDYQALFQFWNNQSYLAGVSFWNWDSNPNSGGSGDNHYTPQNKPAENIMKQWFGNSTPPPDPNPGPSNSSFGSSATISPTNPNTGQATTIQAAISSKGDLSNATIDVEVYNSSNNKVLQQFFSGQNLVATQTKTYTVPWTPQNTGTYSVKIGVFNQDWSTNYYWNDNLAAITVGQGSPNPQPNPQPGPSETNIWWPGNGVSVSGTQPFKAMLTNKDVSSYQMYWQVDGGQLNQMDNSNTDYPHKESIVDLSGWKWKGTGPYTINFVSKDQGGSTLSQKSININVN